MFFGEDKYRRKSILKIDKIKVIERDKLFCFQCKKSIELNVNEYKQLSLKNGAFHHIVPMVYGGENKAYNICILCTDCHLKVHSGKECKEKYITMFENFINNNKLF